MRRPSAREAVFGGVCLLLAAACVRLGIWQLERRAQRLAHNALLEARLSLPPIALTGDEAESDSLAFRRVVVRGELDPDREIILINRARNELPGVHLVTPILLEGSESAILVDRGWIGAEAEPADYRTDGSIEVHGVAKPSQREPFWPFLQDRVPAPGEPPLATWRVINIEGVQAQTPYRLLPVFVEATEPIADGAQPIPDPSLDLSEGPHLSYAIQWFGFGSIALIGGWYWLRRRLRAPGASGGIAAT